MVATLHWMATHSPAEIADKMPADFVSTPLSTKQEYVAALTQDKGQFLPDGMMPAGGPEKVLEVEKLAGKVPGPVNLSATWDPQFVIAAKKLESVSN